MTEYLSDFQTSIFDTLKKAVNNPTSYYNNLTKTMMLLLILFCFYWLIRRGLSKSHIEPLKKIRIKKKVKNSFFILLVIGVSIIWINALNSLAILLFLLGLFGIVLIRGILDNILAWFIIRKRHYFRINQRIEVNDKIGRVVTMGLFHFELAEIKNWLSSESYTGRTIKIPNKDIFDAELFIYNYREPYVRQEISYLIRHDNDWQGAKEIISKAIDSYYQEELLPSMDSQLSDKWKEEMLPTFNMSLDENGITLFCQFLVDYSKVASVKTRLHEEVLEGFNQHGNIEFAVLEVKQVN